MISRTDLAVALNEPRTFSKEDLRKKIDAHVRELVRLRESDQHFVEKIPQEKRDSFIAELEFAKELSRFTRDEKNFDSDEYDNFDMLNNYYNMIFSRARAQHRADEHKFINDCYDFILAKESNTKDAVEKQSPGQDSVPQQISPEQPPVVPATSQAHEQQQ